MFETAIAQLRYAASVIFAVPFSLGSLDQLIESILSSRQEFGEIGLDKGNLLEGPELDEESLREVQLNRFRTQARRAERETEYYKNLFGKLGINPAKMKYEDIFLIPMISKEAVRNDPDSFVMRRSRPAFRTTTTGTTGKPTTVYFSAHEMRTFALLTAISFLQSGQIGPEDILQISTSSRASLGNGCFSQACQRIGAVWYQTGLVNPAQALGQLAERHALPGKKPRASFLNTYASYLGAIIECGLAAGYKPADFGLERISVGGEIVTEGLKRRCQRLFGPVEFIQSYAMTETWPFGATLCRQNHLHFEPTQGLVEVMDPDSSQPPMPGQAGTIIATPFPSYRETSILLRYNTEDVVYPIVGPLECNMKHWPATTHIQGKLRFSIRGPDGWVHARKILEAVEGVEEVPLPARCGFWASKRGVAVEILVRRVDYFVRRKIEKNLEAAGVPLTEMHLVEDRRQLRKPLPLRCDLRELSFDERQIL